MIQHRLQQQPSHAERGNIMVVVITIFMLVIAGFGVFLTMGLEPGANLTLIIEAEDGGAYPVLIDGTAVGETPLTLLDWWVLDSGAFVNPAMAWPPPQPEGTQHLSYSVQTGPTAIRAEGYYPPSGPMSVFILATRTEGSELRTLSISVGSDGHWLLPLSTGGGGSHHMLDGDSQELRFTFKQP